MRKALKKIVSVLSSAMILGMVFPSAAEAGEMVDFVPPVISDAPEYLYEIFDPIMTGKFSAAAPVISSVTSNARPDDGIVVEGIGLENAEIYIYGLSADKTGAYRRAYIAASSDTTVTAVIDENYAYGMYFIWAESPAGMSRPVRINAPEIDWVSSDALRCGETVSIYGENFCLLGESPEIYIEGYGSIAAAEFNPYKITFVLPDDLTLGYHRVYVHNGHGGEYGWSNGAELNIISDCGSIWTGDTHVVSGFDKAAVQAAYNSASDYDTIFFPNGEYRLDSRMFLNKKLRLVGESKDGVIIYSDTYMVSLLSIGAFPFEMSDITFEDRTDTETKSPYLLWAGNSIAKGQSGLKVENCNFIKHKTYSLKSPSDTDYDPNDYSGIEGFSEMEVGPCAYFYDISDVTVSGCRFYAPRGIDFIRADGVKINGNVSYGTWIMDSTNGPCAWKFDTVSHLDISKNGIYGADILSDPDGKLTALDLTFDRSLVIHAHYGPINGVYIGENDIRRVGTDIGNSAEQLLFEDASVIYRGTPSGVDGTELTFNNTGWFYEDGVLKCCKVNTDSSNELNKMNIIGSAAVIVHGRGASQYRRIIDADEASLKLERRWDIEPDSSSLIMIVNQYSDVTVYDNEIVGPDDYYKDINHSTAIQAWANLLNFRVDGNSFANFEYGMQCTPHYSFKSGASAFNVLADVIISGNEISNIRRGITIWFPVHSQHADNDDLTSINEEAYLQQNTVIRRNSISDTVLNENQKFADGGEAITVGTMYNEYNSSTWDDIRIHQGKWVKNTLIENNIFKNIRTANVYLQYHQGDTILRDNYFDLNAQSVKYDKSDKAGAPEVYEALDYTTPPSDNGMLVSPSVPDAYGDVSDGITGNVLDYAALDNFMNGSFDEGLRYWGNKDGVSAAGAAASVEKEENGNSYLLLKENANISNTSTGIYSVPFKISGLESGDKIVVTARYRIGEYTGEKKPGFTVDIRSKDSRAEISTHTMITGSRAGKPYVYYDDGDWTTAETAVSDTQGTVTINGGEKEAEFYIIATGDKGNTGSVYIDDIKVGIVRNAGVSGYDVTAYELTDGSIVNGDSLYPLYGTKETGMYHYSTGSLNGSRAQRITAGEADVTDFAENGLKYWGAWYNGDAGAQSPAGRYASDNVEIGADGGLKFRAAGIKQNGIASASFRIGEKYRQQEGQAILFEYKLESESSTSGMTVGIGSGGAIKAKGSYYRNTGWEQCVLDIDTEATEYCWLYMYSDPESNAEIRNLSLGYKDIGGIEGLYAKSDGSPYLYERGDVNADGAVDIRDLIRLKRYSTGEAETEIYFAAAKLGGDTETGINASDIAALRKLLLTATME